MSEEQIKELQDLIIDKIEVVANGISNLSSSQNDVFAATAITRLVDSLCTLNIMEVE